MMDFEDIKFLVRAGFTADEIRAMKAEPEVTVTAETATETPKTEPAAAAVPDPKSESKPNAAEEKNDDIVKNLTSKIEALTKAVQAQNRLAVDSNKPKEETVDDILKAMMK